MVFCFCFVFIQVLSLLHPLPKSWLSNLEEVQNPVYLCFPLYFQCPFLSLSVKVYLVLLSLESRETLVTLAEINTIRSTAGKHEQEKQR